MELCPNTCKRHKLFPETLNPSAPIHMNSNLCSVSLSSSTVVNGVAGTRSWCWRGRVWIQNWDLECDCASTQDYKLFHTLTHLFKLDASESSVMNISGFKISNTTINKGKATCLFLSYMLGALLSLLSESDHLQCVDTTFLPCSVYLVSLVYNYLFSLVVTCFDEIQRSNEIYMYTLLHRHHVNPWLAYEIANNCTIYLESIHLLGFLTGSQNCPIMNLSDAESFSS